MYLNEKIPASNDRKSYIDIARGVALLFLVLGHIVTGNSRLFNWIFSFHMPLFFFLAGMCAKDTEIRFFPYMVKKIKKRLVPYFMITAAGFLFCMLIPAYREAVFADGLFRQLECVFLMMRPVNLYIGQVWFLASLFWAELYFYLWRRLCRRRRLWLQLAAAFLFVIAADNLWRVQSYVPITGRIYFHLDSACMGAFCYILGFLTKKEQLLERAADKAWLLILPTMGISIYFSAFLNGYVNMCDLVFGNMVFYLISMTCGIAAVVISSFYIRKFSLLEWYGRHSLPLFASHTFLIYLVREWIFLFTGIHYTMMSDVPIKTAFLMTGVIAILFLVVGKGYDLLLGLKKF